MNPTGVSDIQNRIYEGSFERLFALCEKCLWSATIFKSKAQKSKIILGICPVCFNEHPSNSTCIYKTLIEIPIKLP